MNIKLGKVLQGIRKEANLSQQGVAELINCSRGSYSCWEHDCGEIPLTKLLLLLNHCNISLATFLKRVQDVNNSGLLIELDSSPQQFVDIKAELASIGSRIALINQTLSLPVS